MIYTTEEVLERYLTGKCDLYSVLEIQKDNKCSDKVLSELVFNKECDWIASTVIKEHTPILINRLEEIKEYINCHKLPECSQQTNQESTKRKGRTSKPFSEVIITQSKENTLNLLHTLINGRHGKGAIIFLFVAIKNGLITKPTSTQILNEFGDIGNKSLIQKYLNSEYPLYTDDEISGATRALGITSEG